MLVNLFVVTMLGLVLYGLYKQATLLLSLCPWARLTRSYTIKAAVVDLQLHPT